jgi:hypothetical protein
MTFDTMMRWCRIKVSEETVNSATTQHGIEINSIPQKENGGYTNKGVL